MAHAIATHAQDLAPDLIALRHRLHQIPETGLHLPHTVAAVREALAGLDLDYHEADCVTGFMAILRGRAPLAPGRERGLVLLRADMDGLPVTEDTDLTWRSTNGNMHACGHDLHMAGLIGACRILAARADELAGDVVLMFQPGEEGHDGARHMIEEGLLEAAGRLPDHAYSLHVWSSGLPHGFIGTRPGAVLASSDTLAITVTGRGGHGSAPHEVADPIPVAAEIITEAQVIVAREFSIFDPVVATCGQVHAGRAANVIPDSAFLEYTLRAFSTPTRERLIARLSCLAEQIAAAHGMRAEVVLTPLYPVTTNDPSEVDFARQVIETTLPGRWGLQEQPRAAAEDFSRVLEQVPGCFLSVGATEAGTDPFTAPNNHSPRAVYDDSAVPNCAATLAALAYHRLCIRS